MLATVAWTRVDPDDYSTADESVDVATLDDLDALLARLDKSFPAEAPVLASVVRKNGDTLAIGLGDAILLPDDEDEEVFGRKIGLTVLNFCPLAGGPKTYTSVAENEYLGSLTYFYCGTDSDFGGESAIPKKLAFEAVKEFVAGDGMPSCVGWEED